MRSMTMATTAAMFLVGLFPVYAGSISDDPEPVGLVAADGPDATGISEDPEPFLGAISDGPDPISEGSVTNDNPDPFSIGVVGDGPDPLDPLFVRFHFEDGWLVVLDAQGAVLISTDVQP